MVKKKDGVPTGACRVMSTNTKRIVCTMSSVSPPQVEEEEECADVGAVRRGPEAEEGSLESRLQTILRPQSRSPAGRLRPRGHVLPGQRLPVFSGPEEAAEAGAAE